MLRGYFYEEGYIKTCSKLFTLKNCDDAVVHLTNDKVQKQSVCYGAFEPGNKMGYADFERCLLAEK